MAVVMVGARIPRSLENELRANLRDVVLGMEAAPGFRGHWSGATVTGYRVIELWDSREDYQAFMTATSCRTFHPAPSRRRRSSSS
jgi:heme-degrading monooxygenase HmoA